MRILHILDHSIPLHSGYTFRTYAILTQQRRLGWQTFHVTSAKHSAPIDQEALEETIDGLHFYRTPAPPFPWNKAPLLDQWGIVRGLRHRLKAIVERVKPDILHAHSPLLNALAGLGIARRYGLPLIYEVRAFWEDAAVDHGTTTEGSLRYRATHALDTWILRRADAVTCICEGLRNDMLARGIAGEKITVIPNAVDSTRFPFGRVGDPELRAELGLNAEIIVGFIGSFYAYEGLDLLIQALPLLNTAGVSAQLLLVGGGPQDANLKQLAQALGLDAQVRFPGRVPHDQVQRYYDLVDIFVYPRRSMRLTELVTPLKPLEAMAQGKLVVASAVGGHRELIRESQTGELFPPDDVQGLTKAILRLLDDRPHWSERQRQGRQFVESERNWASSVARYEPVYKRLAPGA